MPGPLAGAVIEVAKKPAAKKSKVEGLGLVDKKPTARSAAAKVYRQEYETRDDPKVDLTLERILMWHKVLANICGGLSLQISRRKLSRVDLANWTEALGVVTQEMKQAEVQSMKKDK